MKRKNLFMTAAALFCLMIFCQEVRADAVKTKNMTIRVELEGSLSGKEDESSLKLLARDTMPDLFVMDDDMGAVFRKTQNGVYETTVPLPMGYWYRVVGNHTGSFADFNTSQFLYGEGAADLTVILKNNGNAEQEKTDTPDEEPGVDADGIRIRNRMKTAGTAAGGDTVSYTLSELYNKSGDIADNFSFHVTLPEGTWLSSFYSGTYNKPDVKMSLSYRTDKDKNWRLADEAISSSKAVTIKALNLPLSDGEKITEFVFSSESVPDGFCMEESDPLHYEIVVGVENEDGKKLTTDTRLSTFVQAKKYFSKDAVSTTVVNGVQTGDGNILYLVSLIGLVVSVLLTVLFIGGSILERARKKTRYAEKRKGRSAEAFSQKQFRDYM